MWKSYNKSIIAILSVNTGKYSVIDLGIVPSFSLADAVDLKRNISPHCRPSHAIIYMYMLPFYYIDMHLKTLLGLFSIIL